MRTLARTVPAPVIALGLVCLFLAPLDAQWEPWPTKNVPRTADGKVDMNAPARRTPDGKSTSRASGCPRTRSSICSTSPPT